MKDETKEDILRHEGHRKHQNKERRTDIGSQQGNKEGGVKGGLMSAVLVWTCD